MWKDAAFGPPDAHIVVNQSIEVKKTTPAAVTVLVRVL
ncbi:hypothetical protein L21SP2_0799 [Salinispira pacifica]|uniref:Uncharacterized protein n=1 Tax=Salinispira pacifica TaxID=1307761 RepID=V5WGD0_9SPIO|nr:hypothetical protein L21SP2_0799 [Salinispira pacifica]